MKVIKYQALGKTIVSVTEEDGTDKNVEQDLLYEVERPYSTEMEELAKAEAYKGEYTIVDDGQPDAQTSDADRIAELEEALALLLSGVTE